MSRIKRMLIAMVAVLAIGAMGASAASAGNTGTVGLTGQGTCDVTFDRSAWTAVTPATTPPSWKSNITNVATAPGGTCDVDDVSGSGVLTKNSAGAASFTGNFSLVVLSGFVTCSYSGTLTGTWVADTNPPHNHKKFSATGTVTKTSGGFLCPSGPTVTLDALVDY